MNNDQSATCYIIYIYISDYQWIHLGKLYKLMGSFFQILKSSIELQFFNSSVGYKCMREVGVICAGTCSSFKFVFKILAENQKIFKLISKPGYWPKCNMLCIDWSMHSSRQALQTWKEFFQISKFVLNYWVKKKKHLKGLWGASLDKNPSILQ